MTCKRGIELFFFSIVISVKSCGSIDQNCKKKKKNKERKNNAHIPQGDVTVKSMALETKNNNVAGIA